MIDMDFKFQQESIEKLEEIADKDKHSIIISGISGCGKTYLGSRYARFLHIQTFNTCQPKINDIKTTLAASFNLQDRQVVCIENLDTGSNAASQSLLKFLEEPSRNVYVVITCNNLSKLPNTIISRAISVEINPPTVSDIEAYAKYVNDARYRRIRESLLFSSLKSLSDVRYALNLDLERVSYFEKFGDESFLKGNTSTVMWNLSHFENSTKFSPSIAFRCILKGKCNPLVKSEALQALLAFEEHRLSETAIIGKFVLNLKA